MNRPTASSGSTVSRSILHRRTPFSVVSIKNILTFAAVLGLSMLIGLIFAVINVAPATSVNVHAPNAQLLSELLHSLYIYLVLDLLMLALIGYVLYEIKMHGLAEKISTHDR